MTNNFKSPTEPRDGDGGKTGEPAVNPDNQQTSKNHMQIVNIEKALMVIQNKENDVWTRAILEEILIKKSSQKFLEAMATLNSVIETKE